MGKVQEHKRAAKARRQDNFGAAKEKANDQIDIEGVVEECLPNTMFKITITHSDVPQMVGRQLLGTLAGKMRLYRIRVLPGDGVKGYVSKYDLNKCKITYRTAKKDMQ
jgi:translation initiation factor IF-1